MKCIKLVFSSKGLLKNIGNYVMLGIISTNIVIAVLFKFKGFVILYNKLEVIKNMLQNNIDINTSIP